MMTHKSVVESRDSLVFVVSVSSSSETRKMRSFVKDLTEAVEGLGQMVFVYKNEAHFEPIREGLLEECETASESKEISETIFNRSIKIEWSQFKTYIKQNSRFDTTSEKLVISSSGMPEPIQAKVVDV